MQQTSVAEVKRHIAERIPSNGPFLVRLKLTHQEEFIDCPFVIEWWPQFRTYLVRPAMQVDGVWKVVAIEVPLHWVRYLKRKMREYFGVRHVHNVGKAKNNQARIDKLLGVQYH
jgi:hypothetical protein